VTTEDCTIGLTPASGQVGSATVTVTGVDPYGQTATESFVLTVEPPVPTVTGLTDETVTEGEAVPVETFRLGGQGPFTVSVETTNAALLPPAYVRLSAGCGTESEESEECTLELEPTAGETGTATVVVEAENGSGQVGVGTKKKENRSEEKKKKRYTEGS
jgi:hypothetical protein